MPDIENQIREVDNVVQEAELVICIQFTFRLHLYLKMLQFCN